MLRNVWISDAVMYHPVDPDEVFGLLGPRRQIHIAHHPPVLPHSQMVAAAVDEHLGEVVELGNELLRFRGERERAESFGPEACCSSATGLHRGPRLFSPPAMQPPDGASECETRHLGIES